MSVIKIKKLEDEKRAITAAADASDQKRAEARREGIKIIVRGTEPISDSFTKPHKAIVSSINYLAIR